MATKKKNQPIINDTDHEIETPEGWVIPTQNYDPKLSSYHKDTEIYILKKAGFHNFTIRKMLGEWEYLAYVNIHTLDQRWEKIDMNLFSEEVIREHIKNWSK